DTLEVVSIETIKGSFGTLAVYGTPADSVRAGLKLFNVEFDLVVSGINDGPNLARDILYSGTVGAAQEAKIQGVNAIAISADSLNIEYIYDETIKTLDEVIESEVYDFDGILNINFPRFNFEKPKGVLFTRQGRRYFHTELVKKSNHEDKYYLKGSISQFDEEEISDVWAYDNGYISITPLTLDRTNEEMLKMLSKKQ
ncbi:MAG: 5'/3'-nucleotidase SurE, partial [Acholeplasma sp.]|nr:5'/3'-nucleotidase SurE [Acholeplasma sp.]